MYLGASLGSLFPLQGEDVGDSLNGGWLSDSYLIKVQREQVHYLMFQEPGSLHINWPRISHFHPQMICLRPLDHSKEPSFGKYTLGSLDIKTGIKCCSFDLSHVQKLPSHALAHCALLLQVNVSLKRIVYKQCVTRPLLGSQAAHGTENTKTHQVLLLCVKNTVGSTEMSVCSLFPPFLLNFVFLFLSSSLPWPPSPTSLFAFCSSWFLSHFPGGSTSSPIRVAVSGRWPK